MIGFKQRPSGTANATPHGFVFKIVNYPLGYSGKPEYPKPRSQLPDLTPSSTWKQKFIEGLCVPLQVPIKDEPRYVISSALQSHPDSLHQTF